MDCAIADPPYGETNLDWDKWPAGWVDAVATITDNLWCFGSTRTLLDHASDFTEWKFAQDLVWEKHNGSNLAADRFNRVHENVYHWYRGKWADLHHVPPTTAMAVKRTVRKKARPAQWIGATGENLYVSQDGGPLLMASVIFARSMHGRAINETEKPTEILEPILTYSCPPDGVVLDPFAGSSSTLVAARHARRRAIGVEVREQQCEAAAVRLAQMPLDFGEAS